jgi:hypothetical protein
VQSCAVTIPAACSKAREALPVVIFIVHLCMPGCWVVFEHDMHLVFEKRSGRVRVGVILRSEESCYTDK